jgi:LysR family hydrogen peroxide-inducible transcriptional activator
MASPRKSPGTNVTQRTGGVRKASRNLDRGVNSNVTLRQLQYLLAVVEEGNFSKAARRMHVSTAAVTEQLEKLEDNLGELLIRGRQRTLATALGERVVERARFVLRGVGEIERLASQPETLRIGMIDTVAPYLMPTLLSRRSERILPVQAQTAKLLTLLDEGGIEAAVLAEETVPRGSHGELIGEEELLLVTPAGDTEFGSDVTLAEIADHEVLLLADGHCLRNQVIDVCKIGKSTFGPLEAATLEMLVEMVAKGMGVTLVPEISASMLRRHPGIKITRLLDPPTRRLVLLTAGHARAKTVGVAETLRDAMTELTAHEAVVAQVRSKRLG